MENLKGRVFLYSISACRHCIQAKRSLQELSVPFVEIDIEKYPQCKQEMFSKTGKKSVPQIFFNIGGKEELHKLVSEDKEKLKELLKFVKENPLPDNSFQFFNLQTTIKNKSPEDFLFEVDEYAALVKEIKESGLCCDHWQQLLSYKKSFNGKEFVNWITKKNEIEREEAIIIGKELMKRHFLHNVKNENEFFDGDSHYILLEDQSKSALNAFHFSEYKSKSYKEIGEILHRQILQLYNSFISQDGKIVDYNGISKSEDFENYERLTLELQRIQLEEATKEEKLSFFINIYNSLVIHGCIRNGSPIGLWQRYKFFNTTCYIIGGYTYSLQDIENGILRGNKRGIGNFFPPFSTNDPRLKIALEKAEPFIHFALVCGARSCPAIKTYTSENIYNELQIATEVFLEDDLNCDIDVRKNLIKLSQIFKWYRDDFGQSTDEVLNWIHEALGNNGKQEKLKQVIDSRKAKVIYFPYNWDINS